MNSPQLALFKVKIQNFIVPRTEIAIRAFSLYFLDTDAMEFNLMFVQTFLEAIFVLTISAGEKSACSAFLYVIPQVLFIRRAEVTLRTLRINFVLSGFVFG